MNEMNKNERTELCAKSTAILLLAMAIAIATIQTEVSLNFCVPDLLLFYTLTDSSTMRDVRLFLSLASFSLFCNVYMVDREIHVLRVSDYSR